MVILNQNKVHEFKTKVTKKHKNDTEYTANERLNLKINPPDLEKLKLITRFEGGTLYEKVNQIIEFYVENKYKDRDKKIIFRILDHDKNDYN